MFAALNGGGDSAGPSQATRKLPAGNIGSETPALAPVHLSDISVREARHGGSTPRR